MTVIGTELPGHTHIGPFIILFHIEKPFGNHQGDDVIRIAESCNLNVHHIEALSENLVAEFKVAHDFPHNDYLVVFNYLICHFLFSLLGPRFDRNRM